MLSDRPGPNTENAPQTDPAERRIKTQHSLSTDQVFQGIYRAVSGAFLFTYLQVVVAYVTVSGCQVVVNTLPKAVQTGSIRVVAGLRAGRRFQQETAWTGGVLAGALARCLLQRHKPTEQEIRSQLVNVAQGDIMGKTSLFILFVLLFTWQSRFQRGWPDSIPWCTLDGSSLDPRF